MSDNDIFNNGAPLVQEKPADPLATILNENGEPKYKTVDDALKALAHSQAFIETLKTEKSTVEAELISLREQANKSANIEEVLKKLTANNEPEKPEVATPPVGGLSEDAVAELVRKQLANLEGAKAQKANIDKVQSTLKQKYGDKAVEQVRLRAHELGTTPEKLGELSASDPDMVLALFGTKSSITPTITSVNLPPSAPKTDIERPAKSLLSGATSRDQRDYMLKIKAETYRKHGIEA